MTGSSQQFTATLKDSTGTAVAGTTIRFVVTGVNPYSNSAVTNSSGVATFSYTGALARTDSARASGSITGSTMESNTSSVSWVTPAKPIIMSSVMARFFAGDNTYNFDTVAGQQPLLVQYFPAMTFNPRPGIVIGNPNTNYLQYNRNKPLLCWMAMKPTCSIVIATLFAAVTPAWGQTATGTIVGSVTDNSGAVIAGALVTVANTGTNARQSVSTNAEGTFVVPLLPPGAYRVEVSAQGFKKFEQSGIELRVQQQARVDVSLQVGELSESIAVQADAAVVEATTSSIGKVVDNKRILQLPLNTRNVYTLVNLTPGVTGSIGNQHNAVSYSVNGARGGTFSTLVDGAAADFPTVNGFAGLSVFPSIDAVGEFKIQAQNYSAEFGRSVTSVMNLVYKSGGNQLHGSAYEFLRNSVLDANNFFNNTRGVNLASFKRNQFGGTVSGPVIRDRTFFLVAYEGLRQRQFRDVLTTVPTDKQRNGDFSDTRASLTQAIAIYDPSTTRASGSGSIRDAFPGNLIPMNRFDLVAKNGKKLLDSPSFVL